MNSISRRDLIKGTLAVSAAGLLGSSFAQSANPAKNIRLADFGWSWEGQGFVGGAGISIFGLGEGAKYFGLNKVFNLWGPNNDLAMEKLRSFDEVVCEISPNRPIHCGERCMKSFYDPTPEKFLAEAENVAALSVKYRNIKGVYIDDTLGSDKASVLTPEFYASIYNTLKKANPDLKIWQLVYSRQLYKQDWAGFKSHMDVIKMSVWDSQEDLDLDRHVGRCREIFPDKPLVLNCYLWDYSSMKFSRGNFERGHAFSMDLLRVHWERVLRYLEAGKIHGYTILGARHIDGAPEQARWVRDFIAAN
jgi:hypothetical protein